MLCIEYSYTIAMNTKEKKPRSLDEIDPKMMARIQSLRLMDDDFMSIVFDGDTELTEFTLKILLERDDLRVKSVLTQKEKHNLYGRSVRLDILAEDTEGKVYNVEIQRADKGADARRVRYNLAMLDSHILKRNDNFSALPEAYIIFITENDLYEQNKPLYTVRKFFDCTDKNGKDLLFEDGVHTIYVNGAYRGNNAIGYLMHDFCTPKADEMYFREIAEKVRYHKQETQEVNQVCRAFEEYGNEVAAVREAETKAMVIENLLQQHKLSVEEIAEATNVSIEKVQELAQKRKR